MHALSGREGLDASSSIFNAPRGARDGVDRRAYDHVFTAYRTRSLSEVGVVGRGGSCCVIDRVRFRDL